MMHGVNRRIAIKVSDHRRRRQRPRGRSAADQHGDREEPVVSQWVEANRAYVDKISGGRLGYAHMNDMSEGALRRLYMDLDADNRVKDGIVIDIRNNNGGFINAYAHRRARAPRLHDDDAARTPDAPARSVLGQRALELPTILVTNQHSLSDAEDFTEGYRALKLGKVVGEPTSGWIIYTGSRDAG